MINGIFFDLFGTLLEYGNMTNAWNHWLETFYKYLIPQGLSITQQEFASQCDQFFSKNAPASNVNEMTVYEYRINRLCESLNIYLNIDSISEIANLTVQTWQKEIAPAPDCKKTLKILKKTKILALITNFDHPPHINKLLSHFGLDSFFTEIIISANVGYKKPDPEIFRIALEKTFLKANEVVYVGDTKDDIIGAISSGIKPILINSCINQNKTAYDYYLKDPSENNITQDNNLNVLTITKLSNLIEILA
ncbi:MAG: HAD family hydrolase [bacterium]